MAVKKTPTRLHFAFSANEEQTLKRSEAVVYRSKVPGFGDLAKSIVNLPGQDVNRLSFEVDPRTDQATNGIYRRKVHGVPDVVAQTIARSDSLVANLARARQNHLASFGRQRPDRFATGFVIRPLPETVDSMNAEQRKELKARIQKAEKIFSTCGDTEGVTDEHQSTFSEWMSLSARNAVVNGRIATEIVHRGFGAARKFHYFAAVDAGTIFQGVDQTNATEAVREQAFTLLNQLRAEHNPSKETLTKEPRPKSPRHFPWIQVIHGQPTQAFTSDELRTYNFYPVPDIETYGYPVTPIDTVISAITTHINITTHNKLYFQSGRATRGMLVIKSDDASPQMLNNLKQHFNASINNVNNSWRMPVFGVGTDEEVTWQAIDTGGGRDMEFQYLTDMNAREIFSAFMMSPDELPGWSYLSKGTNNQSLAESNNEWKLQAARDVGMKPLLLQFEDFINDQLFPLIDPDLAKICRLRLVGLEADSPEKEATRTQEDMAIWMGFDDVLERVEKKPVGREWGGAIPLNEGYQAILDKYFTVDEILEQFCDRKLTPEQKAQLNYRRDPFFFQFLQLQQQAQMAQQQAQAQAQQPGPDGQPPQGGGGQPQPQPDQGGGDQLARSIDQAMMALTKSERQLPPGRRKLLAQQRATSEFIMRGFLRDAQETTAQIADVVQRRTGNKKS